MEGLGAVGEVDLNPGMPLHPADDPAFAALEVGLGICQQSSLQQYAELLAALAVVVFVTFILAGVLGK